MQHAPGHFELFTEIIPGQIPAQTQFFKAFDSAQNISLFLLTTIHISAKVLI